MTLLTKPNSQKKQTQQPTFLGDLLAVVKAESAPNSRFSDTFNLVSNGGYANEADTEAKIIGSYLTSSALKHTCNPTNHLKQPRTRHFIS
ncbi:hypothetical protein CEXT_125891 [Caerostris extrusa]|uniref:Uncharacterized protein n=1 Tax=Caerostris extrusa TaxID=172846 RepID=A0AAV4QL13_CAEEX|nr:hypothetical protein CEXT_125891 [Caerostris extrusa]